MEEEEKNALGSMRSNLGTFPKDFGVRIWSLVEEKFMWSGGTRFWSKSFHRVRFKQQKKNGAFRSYFIDKIYPLEDLLKLMMWQRIIDKK